MNFLFHRELAAAALGGAAAGVGAMLPDLWRMADRRVRARRGALELEPLRRENEALDRVALGIEHHLAADSRFHDSRSFLDGERAVAAQVGERGLAAPRLRLFAHITWELCLDGALVRRVGAQRTLDALRDGFAQAADSLAYAASAHHFHTTPGAAERRAAFDARMEIIATELCRGPWVEGYATGRGVAQRVSAVRARVRVPPLSASEIERFGDALDALAPQADAAAEAILRDPGYGAATPRQETTEISRAARSSTA